MLIFEKSYWKTAKKLRHHNYLAVIRPVGQNCNKITTKLQ